MTKHEPVSNPGVSIAREMDRKRGQRVELRPEERCATCGHERAAHNPVSANNVCRCCVGVTFAPPPAAPEERCATCGHEKWVRLCLCECHFGGKPAPPAAPQEAQPPYIRQWSNEIAALREEVERLTAVLAEVAEHSRCAEERARADKAEARVAEMEEALTNLRHLLHQRRARQDGGEMRVVDVLEAVGWGQRHFGSLHTNRHVRLRDMRRAETQGLVRCIGLTAVCDGDGGVIDPERFRNGWVLTEVGRSVLGGKP